MSGTEAIEIVRNFLGAEAHESLGECSSRVIDTYLVSSERTVEIAERACIADTLRLDLCDERLVRWANIFAAAERAQHILAGGLP